MKLKKFGKKEAIEVEQIQVSFIIPVYNAEKYIAHCLESILSQKGFAKEVILVDDGSNDDSVNIINQYLETENIILLQQNHQGAATARNTGIEVASGEWICFVDSDDWVEQDAIENMLYFVDDEDEVVFANYAYVSNKNVKKHVYNQGINKELTQEDFACFQKGVLNKTIAPSDIAITTPWAKLYRRQFLTMNDLCFTPGIKKSQDVLFNFHVYDYAKKGKYIACQMYNYRYNSESLCNKHMPGIVDDYNRQLEIMESFIHKTGKNETLRKDLWVRGTVYVLNALLLDLVHKDNRLPYRERKEKFLKIFDKKILKECVDNTAISQYKIAEQVAVLCLKKRWFVLLEVFNWFYSRGK